MGVEKAKYFSINEQTCGEYNERFSGYLQQENSMLITDTKKRIY